MAVDYQAWAGQIQRLDHALVALEPTAAEVGVPGPQGAEWYELLKHKLLPQAKAEPFLVVAVVGGTNTGKSVVFNHLAGEMASGISPLAAGTKHPVCLVPPALSGATDDGQRTTELPNIFEGFQLRTWQSATDSLTACDEQLLFWREGENVPQRLLLLDTPDIDSDAQVNWQRADTIRQSADVLIAILTQQKYNDAAVKQFFRKAAEADKPAIIVFNQCDLVEDRDYWPQWLATFTSETGIQPEMVYVLPYDRAAANSLKLKFYTVGRDGRSIPVGPADLRAELAALHFDAIKIRTFRGALAGVLDAEHGAPAYLAQVRQASGQFAAAADALSAAEMARVNWPSLPASLLIDEIRGWWDYHRSDWSRRVHGFYRVVGQGITWPVRKAWQQIRGASADPLETFRTDEREAIVETIEKLLAELDRLGRVGNEILQPRLAVLLSGNTRARLINDVQAAHAALPALDDDYREFLQTELTAWGQQNPRAIWWLRSLDHVAAIARPAITVSLAVSGWVLAGDVVSHAAVQVASDTMSHVATEAAITGGVTSGGEALVSATSEGMQQAAARLFRRLQTRYAELRFNWLVDWLERELLGNLLADLRRGAEVPRSPAFREVEAALKALKE
jgi:hypothetical protein